jgi:hypothetical protein
MNLLCESVPSHIHDAPGSWDCATVSYIEYGTIYGNGYYDWRSFVEKP